MTNPINWPELLERVEDDMELLDDLIEIFYEETPKILDDIQKAYEIDDYRNMGEFAHSLKGIALGFSAPILGFNSFVIERSSNEEEYSKDKAREDIEYLLKSYEEVKEALNNKNRALKSIAS